MDGRTRVSNAIERRPLDRVPRYDSFWEDTLSAWRDQGMPADVHPDDFFDWDIRMMYIDASMRMEQEVVSSDGTHVVYKDRAGYTVRKVIGKSRSVGFLDHVTKDKASWNRLKQRFEFDPHGPSRIDAQSYFMHMDEYPTWDQAKAEYDRLRRTGQYLCYAVYGPWEGAWRHRGYSQCLMDLLEDPAWVREMGEAQSELALAVVRHCIDLGMTPDALFLIDDLACTRGLLFSPDAWRGIFKPIYARVGAFLEAHGVSFWLHCCGNCEDLFPDFIDCGVAVIQPLQAHAGLDVRSLKTEYGKDLTFWGNIDVRKMSGAEEECEAEIREKILAAKQGGGYIYHSDHSVPPEVGFERYRWIMSLVDRYGAYPRQEAPDDALR